jgi:sulfite exporter TauE/SafE
MCEPLVTLYAERMTPRPDGGATAEAAGGGRGHLTTHEVRQHALFNVGRAVSYALFGAAFGALGGIVFVTTAELTAIADLVRGSVGVVVGGFIIASGGRPFSAAPPPSGSPASGG